MIIIILLVILLISDFSLFDVYFFVLLFVFILIANAGIESGNDNQQPTKLSYIGPHQFTSYI